VAVDQTVIYEGDDVGALMVILSGRVSIQRTSLSGRTIHMADRLPFEHIGELSLIDGQPRSADAVAIEPCRLLVLSREDFAHVLETDPGLAMNLLASLAKRLREQADRAGRTQDLDALGRLCLELLELADRGVVRRSQQSLADRIGTTRETVNRGLTQLASLGAVEVTGRQILICDESYLRSRSAPI
jgi:CRP-like cAMP-binding protein